MMCSRASSCAQWQGLRNSLQVRLRVVQEAAGAVVAQGPGRPRPVSIIQRLPGRNTGLRLSQA